jgi:hypothetical protein
MTVKEQKEIKAIWTDWNNIPSTVDDGKFTPVKWFRNHINQNYRVIGIYGPSKVDCSFIKSVAKHLGIPVIKPNGIYNLPSFPTNKKCDIIEWINSNPNQSLIYLNKSL